MDKLMCCIDYDLECGSDCCFYPNGCSYRKHELEQRKPMEEHKKPTLYLIRGVPGSGKTTLAKKTGIPDHYEADMFMEANNGYNPFKPELLKEAHAWCLQKTAEALHGGRDVVVSNTFIKLWELQPYKDLAKSLGIKVVVTNAIGSYDNVHGVPKEKIQQMRNNFEYENMLIQ